MTFFNRSDIDAAIMIPDSTFTDQQEYAVLGKLLSHFSTPEMTHQHSPKTRMWVNVDCNPAKWFTERINNDLPFEQMCASAVSALRTASLDSLQKASHCNSVRGAIRVIGEGLVRHTQTENDKPVFRNTITFLLVFYQDKYQNVPNDVIQIHRVRFSYLDTLVGTKLFEDTVCFARTVVPCVEIHHDTWFGYEKSPLPSSDYLAAIKSAFPDLTTTPGCRLVNHSL